MPFFPTLYFFLVLFSLFFIERVNADQTEEKIHTVEIGLRPAIVIEGEDLTHMTMEERMEHYHVPAVSIAVINDGRVEWIKTYGTKDSGTGEPASNDTLFQAASISKSVASLAALRLVQDGVISLDEDVNQKLRSWHLPENTFTKDQKVTLRRILSHSSGINASGFRGYTGNEAIPSLLQILEGKSPANSRPIRVDTTPGSQWRYSGGAFTILQQLLQDVTALPFINLMQIFVLEPLQMNDSTFDHNKATQDRKAATGHQFDGAPLSNKWHAYPEMAAAGLWTTSGDLARFLLDIQKSYQGASENVLTQGVTKQMLTAQKATSGLGIIVEGAENTLRFSHAGKNSGFACYMVAYANRGQGVVIMTNSDNGAYFSYEVMRSVAKAYGWPNYAPIIKPMRTSIPGLLPLFVGKYQQGSNIITISQEGDKLFAVFEDTRMLFELHPENDLEYFAEENGKLIKFVNTGSGQISEIQVSLTRQTPVNYRKVP